MPLSNAALHRLASLGYVSDDDLRRWRWLWDSEGESFFWMFLQKEEQAADEYRQWFPRLQQYAAVCRQKVPIPRVEEFSATEREQHRVLLTKMRQFMESGDRSCILNRKPHQAAILSTTWVGLPAAEEVFRGTGAVILEESERQRWLTDICPVNEEGFWWYALAWWTLTEDLTGDHEEVIRSYTNPEGSSYWVVVSGVQWGGLAGGENHELWKWDGQRAEFIAVYSVSSF